MKQAMGIAACVTLLGMSACAKTPYTYRPTENAAGELAGRSAAVYPLPADAPEGELRVATLGLAHVRSNTGRPISYDAIHVRMSVTNHSTRTWVVDTSKQVVSLGRWGLLIPSNASGSADGVTRLTIAPGATGQIELFYAMPEPVTPWGTQLVPHVGLSWRVDTGNRLVAGATQFDRVVFARR
jgi:hypothetical protein